MRWASNGSTATGYSMGGLIAQLLWRRHPERTSQLVLGASSRNFLGTQRSKWHRCSRRRSRSRSENPLSSALGAGMLGPSLVNDLGGEVRQFALAEMNRTSMTTVAAALVAVSEFTSHDWIGQIDVPVSVL
jgi:3-oxoadipate enol-lactonase